MADVLNKIQHSCTFQGKVLSNVLRLKIGDLLCVRAWIYRYNRKRGLTFVILTEITHMSNIKFLFQY